MRTLFHTVLFTLVAASTAQAHETTLGLNPAAAGDQRVTALRAGTGAPPPLERQPLASSWDVDASAPLAAAPQPYTQQSREYWADVSESQLRAGYALPTTAPGALIRLSPRRGAGGALDPAGVLLRVSGKQLAGDAASAAHADTVALRAAGMDAPDGTLVLRLKSDIAPGKLELAAPNARGAYLVHVFEPNSAYVLTLKAQRDTIVAGDAIDFVAQLATPTKGRSVDLVQGLISAPDGHTQNLEFRTRGDGSYLARIVPDAAHAGGPGLWEVHAYASGREQGKAVLRDAKSAFAVALPTARFDGGVVRDGALNLRVGVDVAGASRYQVSGVLYATAADGSRTPALLAQSAAWLEAGRGSVRLDFNAAALAARGLRAPYELRDLRLVNQADMSLIERRSNALTFGD